MEKNRFPMGVLLTQIRHVISVAARLTPLFLISFASSQDRRVGGNGLHIAIQHAATYENPTSIHFTYEVINDSNESVMWMSTGGENGRWLSVRGPDGREVRDSNYLFEKGSHAYGTLRPGERKAGIYYVPDYFALDRPGHYEGVFHFRFYRSVPNSDPEAFKPGGSFEVASDPFSFAVSKVPPRSEQKPTRSDTPTASNDVATSAATANAIASNERKIAVLKWVVLISAMVAVTLSVGLALRRKESRR